MSLVLTEEQSQALRDQGDCPVEVIDPTSKRAYVLLPREQYEQTQTLLHRETAALRPEQPCLPAPQSLVDLPTPAEVAEEARRRHARRWQKWGGKSIARIEEELKLQFYYGGQTICYLRTERGPVIVIVHGGDDEDYHRQFRALTARQREQAITVSVSRWMDDTAELPLSLCDNEDGH